MFIVVRLAERYNRLSLFVKLVSRIVKELRIR